MLRHVCIQSLTIGFTGLERWAPPNLEFRHRIFLPAFQAPVQASVRASHFISTKSSIPFLPSLCRNNPLILNFFIILHNFTLRSQPFSRCNVILISYGEIPSRTVPSSKFKFLNIKMLYQRLKRAALRNQPYTNLVFYKFFLSHKFAACD